VIREDPCAQPKCIGGANSRRSIGRLPGPAARARPLPNCFRPLPSAFCIHHSRFYLYILVPASQHRDMTSETNDQFSLMRGENVVYSGNW
jgi:hypothetical protein